MQHGQNIKVTILEESYWHFTHSVACICIRHLSRKHIGRGNFKTKWHIKACLPWRRWLADKGFLFQDILDSYGVRVETPEKLEVKKQFSMEEDAHNRTISQARVHVERAIRRVKGIIPIRYEHLLSKMWKVCCRLTAFIPPLVNNEQFQNYCSQSFWAIA